MRAPWAMAQVAVATEASSRSSTGAGSGGTVGSPHEEAEEALPAGPDHHREAGGGDLVEVAQQAQVVVDGLAEPDPRVDPDLVDAEGPRRLGLARARKAVTSATTSS